MIENVTQSLMVDAHNFFHNCQKLRKLKAGNAWHSWRACSAALAWELNTPFCIFFAPTVSCRNRGGRLNNFWSRIQLSQASGSRFCRCDAAVVNFVTLFEWEQILSRLSTTDSLLLDYNAARNPSHLLWYTLLAIVDCRPPPLEISFSALAPRAPRLPRPPPSVSKTTSNTIGYVRSFLCVWGQWIRRGCLYVLLQHLSTYKS